MCTCTLNIVCFQYFPFTYELLFVNDILFLKNVHFFSNTFPNMAEIGDVIISCAYMKLQTTEIRPLGGFDEEKLTLISNDSAKAGTLMI